MLNGLDLFSGIGGLSVALNEWVRPVAYCEIDPYCQAVLLSRISESVLPNAPIWDDIRTLARQRLPYKVPIDIICAGFPCQGISVAGLGKGLEDERSGLFFEIIRLAKEIKPSFIFLENVAAICSRGGTRVVREVTEMGYDCRWCCIFAASVGAPHKRERWFLLAHSKSLSSQQNNQRTMQICFELKAWDKSKRETINMGSSSYWQENKPPVCGVDDGIPFQSHRLRSLGNAVVPEQAKKAFKILMGVKS